MIEWNQVTWYSKLGAIIFFIGVVPTLCFYIGTQYQLSIEAQKVASLQVSKNTVTVQNGKYFLDYDIGHRNSYMNVTVLPKNKLSVRGEVYWASNISGPAETVAKFFGTSTLVGNVVQISNADGGDDGCVLKITFTQNSAIITTNEFPKNGIVCAMWGTHAYPEGTYIRSQP